MLHIYLIKAPSHTSVSKLKDEKWAMDGFVSIFLLQKRRKDFFFFNNDYFYIEKILRNINWSLVSNTDLLHEMEILL